MLIVGLVFVLVLARSRSEVGGGEAEEGEVGTGSGMISLESIHVGGLFSNKDRLMHQAPGGGPSYLRWVSCTTENPSCHIRPANWWLLSDIRMSMD
jgi:hypothetical protein